LFAGALASHVVSSALTVAPMPHTISFEAAATTPTVFTTADAALRQLAGLKPGETLLLHGAAGGVGLAAVQVAHAAGARVVATAGSPSKRSLLRSLGVKVAANSRDTSFAADLAWAGGADVVLNSLTSPGMVGGSLSVLRRGGRFLEIGKRDIWAPAAAAAERPDVAYNLLAIDFMPPEVLQQLLYRLSADLASGTVAPIRAAVHDMTSVAAAMRQMAQARHIGKVVVSAHARSPAAFSSSSSSSAAASFGSANGSVLITGGTGALGQLVSGWLAGNQVQHLVLASRTGKLPASAADMGLTNPQHPLFNSMVSITACDASVASDVTGIVSMLAARRHSSSSRVSFSGLQQQPQLASLMHAGGVLADAAFASQSARGVRQVTAPKAVALQLLTQHLSTQPTANSVLFSSMAALLGSAGQTNYGAANAALDAEAQLLQAAGVAVSSVQFSAWAGAGMAAATASKVEAMGIGALSPAAGLAALEAVVRAGGMLTCGVGWFQRSASAAHHAFCFTMRRGLNHSSNCCVLLNTCLAFMRPGQAVLVSTRVVQCLLRAMHAGVAAL
jgi:NADPH:quinone reductase-like Zn-dependent oxidoreductase